MKNKFGFTLAEILIAIVIIGVIATFTIHTAHNHAMKQKTEKKVAQFYSIINAAMRRSYIDNGILPELERSKMSYNGNVTWLMTYLLPYVNYVEYSNCGDTNSFRTNAVCVRLANGTLFEFVSGTDGGDILFFPDGQFFNSTNKSQRLQRKFFAFQFAKKLASNQNTISQTGFIEPYVFTWNGTRNGLINDSQYGCKNGSKGPWFCTKMLELNGWKIPNDYPW